jgi:hypothetical protein
MFYLVTVLLLMLVLPAGSIGVEHLYLRSAAPLMLLVGKWFVFWAAGVRLFLAGLRQFFQPRFTAEGIFGIRSDDALPLVRELGIANFAAGTVGILSLARPGFVLPVAISAALFYGLAGAVHAAHRTRSSNQNIAMATDLVACVVLIAYVAFVKLG